MKKHGVILIENYVLLKSYYVPLKLLYVHD